MYYILRRMTQMRNGHLMGVFVNRTGPDRYQKHSFIGTVGIEKWLYVEHIQPNSRSTEWREPFVYSGPFQYRSGPVRTNKRTHPYVSHAQEYQFCNLCMMVKVPLVDRVPLLDQTTFKKSLQPGYLEGSDPAIILCKVLDDIYIFSLPEF
jgi:hypothetical protein